MLNDHSLEDCTDVPLRVRLHRVGDHKEYPGIGSHLLFVFLLRHDCATFETDWDKLETSSAKSTVCLTLTWPLESSSSRPQPQARVVLRASCHACIDCRGRPQHGPFTCQSGILFTHRAITCCSDSRRVKLSYESWLFPSLQVNNPFTEFRPLPHICRNKSYFVFWTWQANFR